MYFARANLRAPQTEFVSIDRALGRTLSQRAIAEEAHPAAARSVMDGFAVRSSDTPGRLQIAGEIRMGRVWAGELELGRALAIPTGGVLPAGSDCVVPIEAVRMDDGAIVVGERIPRGDCIAPAGSDMRAGEVLLEPGRRIGGAELAVLATLGLSRVPVFRRPVIAVFSSGDELVDVQSTPGPGQIRDSNRWAVAGLLETLGAAVRHLPTAPDEPGALESLLREGLATCDGVVLTGGSSVGERDLTPQIVDRAGTPGVIVHGLRVKPGKPTVLAAIDGKPLIGLPGNPASAAMILDAVASPIVCALTGSTPRRQTSEAVLAQPYRKRPGWTWYVPVRLDEAEATPKAYPLELRSSSASLLARASGFLTLDEPIEEVSAGTIVRIERFLGS